MQVLNLPARRLDRSEAWLTVVGRMSPGVSAAQAGVDLQSVAAALAADHPATNKQRSLAFAPMVEGNPEVRSLAPVGWIALAIVGVVLLIACFNVAALLLARAADRQREIGVRTALGASRGRILRQFAMEGLMLALVSGVAAIVVAGWSADLLSAFSLPSPIPQRLHIGVDRRLVGFTVMLVALAGIVPSLLPALQATRINLVASMRMETALGPRRSRLRNTFMIAQIAGSTLFVTAALLFLRSFWTQAVPGGSCWASLVRPSSGASRRACYSESARPTRYRTLPAPRCRERSRSPPACCRRIERRRPIRCSRCASSRNSEVTESTEFTAEMR